MTVFPANSLISGKRVAKMRRLGKMRETTTSVEERQLIISFHTAVCTRELTPASFEVFRQTGENSEKFSPINSTKKRIKN